MNALAPMTPEDFEYFAGVVMDLCGIHLSTAKRDLLHTRLSKLVTDRGLGSYAEYRRQLKSQSNTSPEWQDLINAITTNKTDFFRESAHFDFILEKFLPEWDKKNPGAKLRVWTAACSTGEEAYTLAMVLEKYFEGKNRYEIVASDIDTEVLERAQNGVYPVSRLIEIPESYRDLIAKGSGASEGWFKPRKTLQSKIRFLQKNLMSFPFAQLGAFDIIFCRNVFIYFKADLIAQITRAFSDVLNADGILCIGHSESVYDLPSTLNSDGPSVLRKSDGKASLKVSAAAKVIAKPAAKSGKKRVLIVDDSPTIQRLLERAIARDPQLEVVGSLTDPRETEAAIERLKPDVITLDMNMPHLNGCDVLERILPKYSIPVVMVTALAKEEGSQVLRALELGAVDYLQKPSMAEMDQFQDTITEKIRTASTVKIRKTKKRVAATLPVKKTTASGSYQSVVAIGSSTGGTEALVDVLIDLPSQIPPILIVQHIPATFSKALADRLNGMCPFEVKEAADGDLVLAGRVLIAPGGRHMEVVRVGGEAKIRITDGPAVNRHKPSVDVLYDTVLATFGSQAIGVILTGMGNDGAKGLLKMKQAGCQTIAQNEETCVVFGMPREAIALGAAHYVEPLGTIPKKIVSLLAKAPAVKTPTGKSAA
jgi:two-component system, chemotaxis family, protein-glutamate methylesterase/glutaminase